ncbi:hypothetical protein E2I00_019506 [Balaenoptera physalus]|uniref:riboflavin kinase n=1 Tax=Balaenoptera physalus TaxID=9770 RepID=A0A6A1Q0L4_BALPH|nr:hypothetical protein E2I00_019506 [Balaenoptera physalus]
MTVPNVGIFWEECSGLNSSPPLCQSVAGRSRTMQVSCTDNGGVTSEIFLGEANFPEQVVDNLPTDVSTGIYYGWASVGSGDVHKMVVSIGWNPYYKNTKKSMETHIMHTFKEDFYGEILNVAIVGYLRPEKNFDSLEQRKDVHAGYT